MAADGNWDLVLKTPIGDRKCTLTLKSDGNVLTGIQAADVGSADIRDGKVSGDELSWKVSVTTPLPLTLTFKARVTGDAIAGTADTGWMGSYDFTGTRA